MSAALKKIEGVETVDVSVERGSFDITLKPDNTVTLPQLRRTIRSNGSEAREAEIHARGRFVGSADAVALDLLNSSTLPVVNPPARSSNKVVTITGIARVDDKNAEQLTITSVK